MSNNHDEEQPKRNGEFEGRTYLYIRTNPADDGSEPLPASLDGWKSPDIIVIKPGGARGTEAVANQQNQVEVTVTNAGGIDATDAFVDVFVNIPGTAATPATATLIGGGYLSIPGYNMRSITFPWTPGTYAAGHPCLFGRVALYIPFDAYVDATVFDVVGDRHVAQRNISVVEMGDGKTIRFGFSIANIFNKSMRMRLLPRELRDPVQQQQLSLALGCPFAQFGETPLQNFKVDLGGERLILPKIKDRGEILDLTEFKLRGTGLLSPVALSRPRTRLTIEMEPREVRQALLYVERNPDTRPGDLHAIDIVQVTADGTTIGGLTVVVRH